jgi:hypothetical protein
MRYNMAEEIIGLRVEVDGTSAERSVGNIRQQLREANRTLVEAQTQFGDYSTEAIAAAKRVAELRDRVQEAAETAALFDPGAKFKAFSGSLQAVAGGFAAVQGALGLVGVESEDLQKQLLKVQSALALSEGLSRITDSAKDFQRLGAVIQQTTVFQKSLAAANLLTSNALKVLGVSATTTSTGFKVLRGAIVATGIGALAIGLIAVVQNFDKLKAALLNAIPGLKTIADGIGNLVNRVTDFLGITSEAERQTAKALEANAKAIRATERELELNADKYDEFTQRKIKANLDYRKNLEELLKDEKLTEDERARYIKQAREKANREILKADKDRQAASDKIAEDARKKAEERLKAEREARAQAEREGAAELAKLREEATLAAIKDETERALKVVELQVAADRKRIEGTRLSEELKQALLTELEAKGERERQAIRDKAAEDEAAKAKERADAIAKAQEEEAERQAAEAQAALERLAANQALELEIRRGYADTLEEQRQVELDAINAEYDARVAKAAQTGEDIYLIEELRAQKVDELNRKSAASEEALAKMRTQARIDQLSAVSQVASDVAKIVGEQTALGKTLAIASAVIETALSAQRAYSSLVGIPVVGPVLAPIAAGAAIAAGIKNIRTIQQTKIPGAGGDGGGGVPSISAPSSAAASAPIAPQANAQVVGQELNREAINRAGSAATRAYVVESDVSSSQERIRRLERAARLG